MVPDEKKIQIPAKVAAVMLIIGVLSWSWDYYDLMRLVVCGCAAYVAWFGRIKKIEPLFWIMLVCAIIYNPVAPLHFSHSVRVFLNIVFAFAFWTSAIDPSRFSKIGK